MSILQVTAVWNGFVGAPGYTTMHFTNAGLITTAVDNAVEGVRALFDDLKSNLQSGTTVQVMDEVKELDEATGALIALHSAGSVPALVTGTGVSQGASSTGAVISWGTNGINRARRVRGRTFIIPCNVGVYQSNGTLVDVVRTQIATAAEDFRTSAAYEFLVWSRPRAGAGGAAFAAVSSSVPDMAAVLRSRRD